MTTRDDIRASKALQGADFPATKDQVLDYAQSHGADSKSLEALHALPDRQYANIDDVAEAVPQEPEGENQPGGSAR
ncbi:hypothetical protein GCM10009720_06190 [Yaniella flava]|uniref:DUF2795 domain-containing protein n=1 Tax=Yaniella flava TaxID=287930 RepID=A0ABP5FL51_9MICC|nr:DUF2795 domain-containing protein [Micrococcaceae bacterium]